jgi:hypothetical protein
MHRRRKIAHGHLGCSERQLRGSSSALRWKAAQSSGVAVLTASRPVTDCNVDLSSAGVLVRAEGGVGLPPLAPEQLVEPDDGPARPLLLLDFDDRHHPLLRRRAALRRRAYAERGWLAPGVDPVEARVQQFLDSRPAEGLR